MAELQQFSIVDFLARLGHHPVRKTGKEHFYHSMLRETGHNTPSLTVWDAGGKWRDWGGPGEANITGGGIVQLGAALWPKLPFVDMLAKISETLSLDTALIPEYRPPVTYPVTKESESFRYELVRTGPIGTNYLLNQYLEKRQIRDVAAPYLSEVYYRRNDHSQEQRDFYAIGWQNIAGGWEFANAKGYKSSIGPKAISIITGKPDQAVLFEGYFDFLSWLKAEKPSSMPTVIVLNSVSMLAKAIEQVRHMPKVSVYFDLDEPGRRCTRLLCQQVPQANDRATVYADFKDYNEMLMAARPEMCRGDPAPTQKRGR